MVPQTVVTVLCVLISLFSNHALIVVGQIIPSAIISFPYGFGVEDAGRLLTYGNARYNSPYKSYDMTSPDGDVSNFCGRVVFNDTVRMVDKKAGQVASFNTSFTFSFHSIGSYCGYGMAFTFAANPGTSELQSRMQKTGMCTFDVESQSPSNRVFAVKFASSRHLSTFNSQLDDPSDSNIGVVFSNKGNTTVTHYNLCSTGLSNCSYFCGQSEVFSAWIDYDSAAQILEVRFGVGSLINITNYGSGKPVEPQIRVLNFRLEEVLDDEMYVGFTSSTKSATLDSGLYLTEIHRISAWNFNSSGEQAPPPSSTLLPSPLPARPHSNSSQVGLIAGICAAVFGAALMGLCFFCCFKHKSKKLEPRSHRNYAHHSTSTLSSDTNCRAYTFKELRSITKNFSDSELLSSGAFGDVYKGTPPSGGRLVAVKRIKQDKEHGQASFDAEANSLKQIRHRNLLQLRGWCEGKQGLFLAYDFMSNSSLDKWLHPKPNSAHSKGLSWNVRHFILAGVASGLEYLHEGWVQCVLHRDIKSSNVMLDENFNGTLGDFGLARLVDHRKRQKTTMLAGTLGYMAPEMHFTGRATKETDVYAFGVLVLEVVSGRTPFLSETSQFGDQPGDFLLLERVWRAHEAEELCKIVDPKLLNQDEGSGRQDILSEDFGDNSAISMTGSGFSEMKMITKVLQLGLLCCLPNPSERPSMRMVNQWFQSSEVGSTMEFPSLPPTKPALPRQYNTISMPQSLAGTSSSQWSDGARFSASWT